MPNWKRSRASWATRHRAPLENAPEPLAVCTTRPDQPRFNMYDMLLVCGAVQHATGYEISWEPCYEGGLVDGVLRLPPRGTAFSSAGCVCSPRTAVAHRSRGVSAPPCVRASSATGTLVHEHPSLGAPLDLELPSANGRVYEASPGRTALCTSASPRCHAHELSENRRPFESPERRLCLLPIIGNALPRGGARHAAECRRMPRCWAVPVPGWEAAGCGGLRRGVGARCAMSNRLSRIAYWLAVKKELEDARPATAEVHSSTRA